MKQLIQYIVFIFLVCNTWGNSLYAQSKTIRVAAIGNSITYGAGFDNPKHDSYPGQLQELLGKKYLVGNFGHSGATLLKKGHNPYFKTEEFKKAVDFNADIAIIHLGINDTDPRT